MCCLTHDTTRHDVHGAPTRVDRCGDMRSRSEGTPLHATDRIQQAGLGSQICRAASPCALGQRERTNRGAFPCPCPVCVGCVPRIRRATPREHSSPRHHAYLHRRAVKVLAASQTANGTLSQVSIVPYSCPLDTCREMWNAARLGPMGAAAAIPFAAQVLTCLTNAAGQPG